MLVLMLGCGVATTEPDPLLHYDYGSLEVLDMGCDPMTLRCAGDQDGTDRCWVHTPAGEWDCASPEDCGDATEEAIFVTCPPDTGDTGL
jgi:hypothetical protein